MGLRILLSVLVLTSLGAESFSPDYLPGHSVLVGRNAEESTAWKFALIQGAKQSIELATGFSGGEMFPVIVRILRDRMLAEPGLRVHLVVARSFCLLPSSAEDVLEAVKRQFPDRFHYQVTGMQFSFVHGHWQTREHHVKLLVVDEKYFVVGGTNMYDSYCKSTVTDAGIFYFDPVRQLSPRACCDMDVCCVGPLVKDMRALFFELWDLHDRKGEGGSFPMVSAPVALVEEIEGNPRMVKDVLLRMASGGPDMRYGACTRIHEQAIQRAQQSIDLMHMYTHPHKSIQKALETALKRDLSLRIVTNGNEQTGFSPVSRVFGFFNRSTYLPLLKLGKAEIYEFNLNNTLYHKKVMIIDRRYSLIGSYNFGKKSHYGDYEVTLEIDSPEVAAQFLAVMEQDIQHTSRCDRSQAETWFFSWWYRAINALQRSLIVGPLL